MQINPSEVTKILKEQIKKFGEKAEVSEVGQVLSVILTHQRKIIGGLSWPGKFRYQIIYQENKRLC